VSADVPCELIAFNIDAADPGRLAAFWGELLSRDVSTDEYGVATLAPSGDDGFAIRFPGAELPKVGLNRMHFDLTSASLDQQRETVERALDLGGQHLDVGQGDDATHVVLADPEGNEFCVIEPDNSFLGGCGFIGAIACDGTREVGYFWSEALGWPLVWDQDQETAIQSPAGGTKISWGGPPINEKTGKNRVHFDLRQSPGVDVKFDVERLISLGALGVTAETRESGNVFMWDPDGNEFCLRRLR
jgi:hypothetical protein